MSDSFDPVWERIHSTQAWGRYPQEHVIRFVARNFYGAPDRRAVKLLDVGAGQGACTWFMAREGFSVSALDCAPAVEKIVQRLSAEKLDVDARAGDAVSLPWADDTFDGAVDNFCLCTVPTVDVKRALAEVHRVLRPGGVFLTACFNDRTTGYGLGDEVEPGGFVAIREGALANLGLNVFRTRPQLDVLLAAFTDRVYENISWTANGMRERYEAWVVACKKPGRGTV
jgi:ubiquinone/menaquinone biosynthesis C-methylase UbiE